MSVLIPDYAQGLGRPKFSSVRGSLATLQTFLASRAQIAEKRQQIAEQRRALETSLQKSLTARKAAAASSDNDTSSLMRLEKEAKELEATQQSIEKQAANLENNLQREEMLAKAKSQAKKQQVKKTAEVIGKTLDDRIGSFLKRLDLK